MGDTTTTDSRSQAIPAGYVPAYGYVELSRVEVASAGPLHLPAVAAWHDRIRSVALTAPGPGPNAPQLLEAAPFGEWSGDQFRLLDGRHRLEALRIAGFAWILCWWLAKATK